MVPDIQLVTQEFIQSVASEEDKLALGALVFQALPEMYEQVPMEHDALYRLLAEQIAEPMTETSETWAIWEDGRPLGLLSIINAEDLKISQRNGTMEIFRRLNKEGRQKFTAALDGYGKNIEPLAVPEGKYYSRLAVAQYARGKGIARILMRHGLALYGNLLSSMHVADTNAVVTKLHKSLGFTFQSEEVIPIRVLLRHANLLEQS